ncbi:Cysteine-rich secretory protein family protein [compost metagenome]
MPRQSSGAVALAVALAVAGCSVPPAPGPQSGRGTLLPADGDGAALVAVTNRERARAGLGALRTNDALERAARIQAEQIATAGRLEHTVAGADYPRLEDRLAAVGYTWRTVAENLAFGQSDAAGTVGTWMASASHRGNILNAEFAETGGARVVDRNGRWYYVQVFARPQ